MSSTVTRPSGILLRAFLDQLAHQPAVLVRVVECQGSVPREAGTWMAVFSDTLVGTVGGGHLEHTAIAAARGYLNGDSDQRVFGPVRFALGPSLGQCCGGVMHVQYEKASADDVASLAISLAPKLAPVALFGGGHVGHALARVLSSLPFVLTWVDSRDGVFPIDAASNIVCEHSDPVEGAVRGLAPQSCVLIMSFSHAEDLEVVAACLLRHRQQADLPFIGLIGSKTKWATFQHRLAARGFTADELAQVTSPIGVRGIARKEPEVIAVAVAAQLLQITDRL